MSVKKVLFPTITPSYSIDSLYSALVPRISFLQTDYVRPKEQAVASVHFVSDLIMGGFLAVENCITDGPLLSRTGESDRIAQVHSKG